MAEELTFFDVCSRLNIEPPMAQALISEGWLPKGVKRGANKKVWDWDEVLKSRHMTDPRTPPNMYGPYCIYFIAAREFVKVGYTVQLRRRIWGLQTDIPYELELLHSEPGDRDTESYFHQLLSHAHWRGEWFHRPPVEVFIEHLKNKCAPDVAGALSKALKYQAPICAKCMCFRLETKACEGHESRTGQR